MSIWLQILLVIVLVPCVLMAAFAWFAMTYQLVKGRPLGSRPASRQDA